MASPSEITVSQLSRLIGTPNAPVLIDARAEEAYREDPFLIPGAVWHSPDDIAALEYQLKDARAVVYCVKGFKFSQGAAAILRANGVAAEYLSGGIVAWRENQAPLVPVEKIPPRNAQGQTVWVTRHRPKIDRIACPWLIRRFVDPNAQFLFVAPSEVLNVADKFNATPFDMEDVFWSHRGEYCTFDTMIEEFGLHSDALHRLADIVRGADTNRLDLTPQSSGLLAASLGFSRMYRDDIEQLDASMALFDAFYRWARDATDEDHDWPGTHLRAEKGKPNQ